MKRNSSFNHVGANKSGKFSSLNLSATYRPSAPAQRHGGPASYGRMVVLGKNKSKPSAKIVAPKPINIKSMRSESTGDSLPAAAAWGSGARQEDASRSAEAPDAPVVSGKGLPRSKSVPLQESTQAGQTISTTEFPTLTDGGKSDTNVSYAASEKPERREPEPPRRTISALPDFSTSDWADVPEDDEMDYSAPLVFPDEAERAERLERERAEREAEDLVSAKAAEAAAAAAEAERAKLEEEAAAAEVEREEAAALQRSDEALVEQKRMLHEQQRRLDQQQRMLQKREEELREKERAAAAEQARLASVLNQEALMRQKALEAAQRRQEEQRAREERERQVKAQRLREFEERMQQRKRQEAGGVTAGELRAEEETTAQGKEGPESGSAVSEGLQTTTAVGPEKDSSRRDSSDRGEEAGDGPVSRADAAASWRKQGSVSVRSAGAVYPGVGREGGHRTMPNAAMYHQHPGRMPPHAAARAPRAAPLFPVPVAPRSEGEPVPRSSYAQLAPSDRPLQEGSVRPAASAPIRIQKREVRAAAAAATAGGEEAAGGRSADTAVPHLPRPEDVKLPPIGSCAVAPRIVTKILKKEPSAGHPVIATRTRKVPGVEQEKSEKAERERAEKERVAKNAVAARSERNRKVAAGRVEAGERKSRESAAQAVEKKQRGAAKRKGAQKAGAEGKAGDARAAVMANSLLTTTGEAVKDVNQIRAQRREKNATAGAGDADALQSGAASEFIPARSKRKERQPQDHQQHQPPQQQPPQQHQQQQQRTRGEGKKKRERRGNQKAVAQGAAGGAGGAGGAGAAGGAGQRVQEEAARRDGRLAHESRGDSGRVGLPPPVTALAPAVEAPRPVVKLSQTPAWKKPDTGEVKSFEEIQREQLLHADPEPEAEPQVVREAAVRHEPVTRGGARSGGGGGAAAAGGRGAVGRPMRTVAPTGAAGTGAARSGRADVKGPKEGRDVRGRDAGHAARKPRREREQGSMPGSGSAGRTGRPEPRHERITSSDDVQFVPDGAHNAAGAIAPPSDETEEDKVAAAASAAVAAAVLDEDDALEVAHPTASKGNLGNLPPASRPKKVRRIRADGEGDGDGDGEGAEVGGDVDERRKYEAPLGGARHNQVPVHYPGTTRLSGWTAQPEGGFYANPYSGSLFPNVQPAGYFFAPFTGQVAAHMPGQMGFGSAFMMPVPMTSSFQQHVSPLDDAVDPHDSQFWHSSHLGGSDMHTLSVGEYQLLQKQQAQRTAMQAQARRAQQKVPASGGGSDEHAAGGRGADRFGPSQHDAVAMHMKPGKPFQPSESARRAAAMHQQHQHQQHQQQHGHGHRQQQQQQQHGQQQKAAPVQVAATLSVPIDQLTSGGVEESGHDELPRGGPAANQQRKKKKKRQPAKGRKKPDGREEDASSSEAGVAVGPSISARAPKVDAAVDGIANKGQAVGDGKRKPARKKAPRPKKPKKDGDGSNSSPSEHPMLPTGSAGGDGGQGKLNAVTRKRKPNKNVRKKPAPDVKAE